ncbi:glycosyltransferase family 1 protein, partial [Actinospica acidiphila]
LGAAGRDRVLANFTWARAAEGTVARYREAIETAHAGRGRTPRATAPAPQDPVPADLDLVPDALADTGGVPVTAADTSDRESRATC